MKKPRVFPTMRCWVVDFLPPKRARFECPMGHKFIRTIFPQNLRTRHISEDICRKFAHYWKKDNNGVSMDCPVCARQKGEVTNETRSVRP